MDKHKYYNKVLYELFDESYDLMAHENFVKYVIAQRHPLEYQEKVGSC